MSNRPKRQVSRSAAIRTSQEQAQSRRTWIIIGVIGAALVVVAVASLSVVSSPTDEFAYRSVEVQGASLPVLTGGTDTAVGLAAPELIGQSFDGSPIEIVGDGRPKVVMTVAHWCPHCQNEVPVIEEWIDENGLPADVDLYSIATGTSAIRDNYPPDKWLEREGWTVPVLVDSEDNEAAAALGQSGTPFWVAIDAEGNVVQRASGEIGVAGLEMLIEAAQSGTPQEA
jgi:thiol-disulfide isomerase/thioredoxin